MNDTTPTTRVTIYYASGQDRLFVNAQNVETFARDSCGYVLTFKVNNQRFMFTTLSCAGWSVG